MDELEKKVLNTMKKAGEPTRPGETPEKAGLDKKDVTKIINQLKKDGRVDSPKRCSSLRFDQSERSVQVE